MYRKWTVGKRNSMTMNKADSKWIDDPRMRDAFAIAGILVNLCFSLANHCSQSCSCAIYPRFIHIELSELYTRKPCCCKETARCSVFFLRLITLICYLLHD